MAKVCLFVGGLRDGLRMECEDYEDYKQVAEYLVPEAVQKFDPNASPTDIQRVGVYRAYLFHVGRIEHAVYAPQDWTSLQVWLELLKRYPEEKHEIKPEPGMVVISWEALKTIFTAGCSQLPMAEPYNTHLREIMKALEKRNG